jgi:hypothetical protein
MNLLIEKDETFFSEDTEKKSTDIRFRKKKKKKKKSVFNHQKKWRMRIS